MRAPFSILVAWAALLHAGPIVSYAAAADPAPSGTGCLYRDAPR
jgi:hypothetical protein